MHIFQRDLFNSIFIIESHHHNHYDARFTFIDSKNISYYANIDHIYSTMHPKDMIEIIEKREADISIKNYREFVLIKITYYNINFIFKMYEKHLQHHNSCMDSSYIIDEIIQTKIKAASPSCNIPHDSQLSYSIPDIPGIPPPSYNDSLDLPPPYDALFD